MLQINDLSFEIGDRRIAGLSMSLEPGHYAVVMGATGTGKTTLLETICGLHPTVNGSITLYDNEITHLSPAERSIGYVPQDLALFSTMTVSENLGYGLRIRHENPRSIARRVSEIAGLLAIQGLLDRYPGNLSGGEARRVALGRAMSISPRLLLLDEPFVGLDEATREEVCTALKSLHSESNLTVVHVTHDHRDAQQLATHVFEFRNDSMYEIVTPSQSIASTPLTLT